RSTVDDCADAPATTKASMRSSLVVNPMLQRSAAASGETCRKGKQSNSRRVWRVVLIGFMRRILPNSQLKQLEYKVVVSQFEICEPIEGTQFPSGVRIFKRLSRVFASA